MVPERTTPPQGRDFDGSNGLGCPDIVLGGMSKVPWWAAHRKVELGGGDKT